MADWSAWSVIRSSALFLSCFLTVVACRSRAKALARMTSLAARGKTLQRVRGGLVFFFLVRTTPNTRVPVSLSSFLSLGPPLPLLYSLAHTRHTPSLPNSWRIVSGAQLFFVGRRRVVASCWLPVASWSLHVPPSSFFSEKSVFLIKDKLS